MSTIERGKALAEAATRGEWRVWNTDSRVQVRYAVGDGRMDRICDVTTYMRRQEDAAHIAHHHPERMLLHYAVLELARKLVRETYRDGARVAPERGTVGELEAALAALDKP